MALTPRAGQLDRRRFTALHLLAAALASAAATSAALLFSHAGGLPDPQDAAAEAGALACSLAEEPAKRRGCCTGRSALQGLSSGSLSPSSLMDGENSRAHLTPPTLLYGRLLALYVQSVESISLRVMHPLTHATGCPPARPPAAWNEGALSILLSTRVCGSPAVDGYSHVDPDCLERSPTNVWWQRAQPAKVGGAGASEPFCCTGPCWTVLRSAGLGWAELGGVGEGGALQQTDFWRGHASSPVPSPMPAPGCQQLLSYRSALLCAGGPSSPRGAGGRYVGGRSWFVCLTLDGPAVHQGLLGAALRAGKSPDGTS